MEAGVPPEDTHTRRWTGLQTYGPSKGRRADAVELAGDVA